MNPDKQSFSAPARVSVPVYRLKITLLRCRPPIWRRVLVSGDTTLDRLHAVIQADHGMGRLPSSLFDAGAGQYSDPAAGLDADDEAKARLSDIASQAGASFVYTCDFGDDWQHKVVVEEITAAVAGFNGAPILLKRSGACSREDSGGFVG